MMNASSLQGKRILITREQSQAQSFADKISSSGGKPIIIPLIKIDCRDDESLKNDHIAQYDWIFMTSANGVHCFFTRFKQQNQLHHLKTCKFAVVGHKTELALKSYGFKADFIPSIYNAETMANEFRQAYPKEDQGRLLLVRGNISRKTLPIEFKKHGYQLDMIEVYETRAHFEMKDRLHDVLKQGELDFVTFTSPSTVRVFSNMVDHAFEYDKIVCVCIGTTTKEAALQAGFKKILIPDTFTIEGMMDRMKQYISTKG